VVNLEGLKYNIHIKKHGNVRQTAINCARGSYALMLLRNRKLQRYTCSVKLFRRYQWGWLWNDYIVYSTITKLQRSIYL